MMFITRLHYQSLPKSVGVSVIDRDRSGKLELNDALQTDARRDASRHAERWITLLMLAEHRENSG
jgi:hypothetical protein